MPQLIARVGRWLRNALTLSYLKFFTPEALLAAAGWDKSRLDGFFDERFCIEVPAELVRYVFPCAEQLAKEVRGGLRARGSAAPRWGRCVSAAP